MTDRSLPSRPATLTGVVRDTTRRQWMRWSITGLALAGAALWLAPRAALAAPAPTVVEAVQLPAWVERHGQRRPAQPGIQLRNSDKAVTAAQARMLLRLPDRSEMKLGEATEMVIEDMSLQSHGVAQPKKITSVLRLITGVFWYATDMASELSGTERTLNLKLATATVGIRGTEFWSMSDAAHDAVCVFDGTVAVMREDKPEFKLDKPGAFWVTFTGKPETPPGQATPDQLSKFMGQVEFAPGKGVLTQDGRWRAVLGLWPSAERATTLREKLATAGYPAEVMAKNGQFEVRINQLATREDAEAVLKQLQANTALGVTDGRVALANR